MKKISEYLIVFLSLVLLTFAMWHSYKVNDLKDEINTLQNLKPTVVDRWHFDTIAVDSTVIKWKTKYINDTLMSSDTLWLNDTIIINNIVESPLDSFYTTSTFTDSTISANVNIMGRGVYEKTFIDSISMNYSVKQQVVAEKKRCWWLRKLFCGCE